MTGRAFPGVAHPDNATHEAPPPNEHPRGCYTARTPQHGALGGCDGDGHYVCRSCRFYEPPSDSG